MAKIPFDINKRPEIEAGKYEVVTRSGNSVRIICWDKVGKYPVVFLAMSGKESFENMLTCDASGRIGVNDCNRDLFLVPTDPGLTEFEHAFGEELFNEPFDEDVVEEIKAKSAKLLELARKELNLTIGDYGLGYAAGYIDGRSNGKAEALKDLPRWKKCEDGNTDRLELEALCREAGSPIEIAFRANGYRIFLSDLEKLPKEDEK